MPDLLSRTARAALLTAATMALVHAAPVSAQQSTTRGFVVGAHLGGASIKVEDADRANGGGGGILIGYGLNRTITIYGQFDGATFDVENPDVEGTWTMGHADIGVRFHFANSLRTFVPYLQGAFSARVVSVSDIPASNPLSGEDVSLSGGAFTFGGGLMLYAKQTLAFDLGLLFSGGEFTDVTVGNTTVTGFDADADSSRFNIGIVWWP